MKEKFQLKQTVVTIVADARVHIENAKEAIRSHRRELERFIALNPFFLDRLLEPLDECIGAPPDDSAPHAGGLLCRECRPDGYCCGCYRGSRG